MGPVALSSLRVASVYEGAVRASVIALKYKGQRRLASPLGDLLVTAFRHEEQMADVVVPVPLHHLRRRVRGYNQAELLARRCAQQLGLPCRTDVLVRQRATAPQVGLPAAERRANVEGAFALTSVGAAGLLAGKHILLIDDVTTTGSTLDAAAAAIMAANPAAVHGLAVSRSELADDGREAPGARLRQARRVWRGAYVVQEENERPARMLLLEAVSSAPYLH